VARKGDIKQFRQACSGLGMSAQERHHASIDLHAEKKNSGNREHMTYGDLLRWLRQWKDEH